MFHENIALPSTTEDPLESSAIRVLTTLISLFAIANSSFFRTWNNSGARTSVPWTHDKHLRLTQLQMQLTSAVQADLKLTDAQRIGIGLTQIWLRQIVWQLSITHQCVSTTASEECMTFDYPIELARQAVALTTDVSPGSLEIHGITLVRLLSTWPRSLETDSYAGRKAVRRCLRSHRCFDYGHTDS